MTDVEIACNHDWQVYDVYWVSPNLGNAKCALCGKRRKSMKLTDKQVMEFIEAHADDDHGP